MSPYIGHAAVSMALIPYSMDLVHQVSGICSATDECFDGLKFVSRTGLESARIVKDEVGVGGEDQLIPDIMITTLRNSEIVSCHQIKKGAR